MAEVFAGYKTLETVNSFKKAGEGMRIMPLFFIGDMMKTQSFIDDGAAIRPRVW